MGGWGSVCINVYVCMYKHVCMHACLSVVCVFAGVGSYSKYNSFDHLIRVRITKNKKKEVETSTLFRHPQQ